MFARINRRFSSAVKVHYEKAKSVAVLTLNRPDQLNAMTVEMGEAFKHEVSNLAPEVRAVILTGEGRAFSAGGDIKFLEDRANDTPHNNTVEMLNFYHRYLAIRSCKVPVISAIHGPAVGAGLCLAMATDIRITHNECKLQFPFTKLGLHPGMAATFFLPQAIGYQAATQLLLTGDTISGIEALSLGMVSESLEEDKDVLPRALEIASSIASNPLVGIQTTLATLRTQQDQMAISGGLQAALVREADAQCACYATKDLADKVQATKERISGKKKS